MGNKKDTKEDSFKSRVAETAISCAKIYRDKFVKYDYLVCSEAFSNEKCQEIRAEGNNYLHLLGLNTSLSPQEFYQKCIDGKLEEIDFDFDKKGQVEKSVKGSVRQKMKELPEMLDMFKHPIMAEEDFKKNRISCVFAAADSSFTIGFVKTGRPKSLMRKNQLDEKKKKPVELVLRKQRGEQYYQERVYGDENSLEKYKQYISKYIL